MFLFLGSVFLFGVCFRAFLGGFFVCLFVLNTVTSMHASCCAIFLNSVEATSCHFPLKLI